MRGCRFLSQTSTHNSDGRCWVWSDANTRISRGYGEETEGISCKVGRPGRECLSCCIWADALCDRGLTRNHAGLSRRQRSAGFGTRHQTGLGRWKPRRVRGFRHWVSRTDRLSLPKTLRLSISPVLRNNRTSCLTILPCSWSSRTTSTFLMSHSTRMVLHQTRMFKGKIRPRHRSTSSPTLTSKWRRMLPMSKWNPRRPRRILTGESVGWSSRI